MPSAERRTPEGGGVGRSLSMPTGGPTEESRQRRQRWQGWRSQERDESGRWTGWEVPGMSGAGGRGMGGTAERRELSDLRESIDTLNETMNRLNETMKKGQEEGEGNGGPPVPSAPTSGSENAGAAVLARRAGIDIDFARKLGNVLGEAAEALA